MTEKNFVKFNTEIVNGVCPTCDEYTMLVGITRQYFRCITCGADLEQHVNGKISYIPTLSSNTLRSKIEHYFTNGKSGSRAYISQNEYWTQP
jgi:transcription initiation factor IIE alpha subunit